MVSRLAAFLGLDPSDYNFETVSKDAAAVHSAEGREFDRRLRDYCAVRPARELETELNKV